MLRSLLFTLFISTFLFANDLPAPYSDLQKVYPFVDHGWYNNGPALRHLIKAYRVRTIVEVGCWLGKSTIDMARNLPDGGLVYAVDHWKGSTEHQPGQGSWKPFLPYLYEQFLSNVIHAKLTHKIIPMRMESLEAAAIFKKKPDLIYIDAAHDTASVYKDLCAWYPYVKGRGILCGDDWGWASVRKAVTQFAQENQLSIEAHKAFWRIVE